jgi:hypothetical protein
MEFLNARRIVFHVLLNQPALTRMYCIALLPVIARDMIVRKPNKIRRRFSGFSFHGELKLPITISIDEPVKMSGQSLNGRNEILKPVNSETSDNALRVPNEAQ